MYHFKSWVASLDSLGEQDLRFIEESDLAGFQLKPIDKRRLLERVSLLKMVLTTLHFTCSLKTLFTC